MLLHINGFILWINTQKFVIDRKCEYCKKARMQFQHNIHVTPTEFRNASRILKQTESLVSQGIVEKVTILSFYVKDQCEQEALDANRTVIRLKNSIGMSRLGQFFITWVVK